MLDSREERHREGPLSPTPEERSTDSHVARNPPPPLSEEERLAIMERFIMEERIKEDESAVYHLLQMSEKTANEDVELVADERPGTSQDVSMDPAQTVSQTMYWVDECGNLFEKVMPNNGGTSTESPVDMNQFMQFHPEEKEAILESTHAGEDEIEDFPDPNMDIPGCVSHDRTRHKAITSQVEPTAAIPEETTNITNVSKDEATAATPEETRTRANKVSAIEATAGMPGVQTNEVDSEIPAEISSNNIEATSASHIPTGPALAGTDSIQSGSSVPSNVAPGVDLLASTQAAETEHQWMPETHPNDSSREPSLPINKLCMVALMALANRSTVTGIYRWARENFAYHRQKGKQLESSIFPL